MKKYYVALLDKRDNTIRVVPNTPKGRDTIKKFVNDNTTAYRVGAESSSQVAEVLSKDLGVELTQVKIKYTKNIPVVTEIEL